MSFRVRLGMIKVRSYNWRYQVGIVAVIHRGRSIEGIYAACQPEERRKNHSPLTRRTQPGLSAMVVRSYIIPCDRAGTGGDEKRSGR